MSETKAPRLVNLLASLTFFQTVRCSLPGSDGEGRRPFEFKAEFKLVPQAEWEELIEDSTKSEALREVLVGVSDNVPGGTLEDGTVLTPVDTVIYNPLTCDAAVAAYNLYVSEDSRALFKDAGRRKNLKRSRR